MSHVIAKECRRQVPLSVQGTLLRYATALSTAPVRQQDQSVPDGASTADRAFREEDSFLGWSGMADRGIAVHDLPGHHGQHFRPPNLAILAQELTAALAQR